MAEADDIPADERLWADGNAFAAYHAYPGGFRNNVYRYFWSYPFAERQSNLHSTITQALNVQAMQIFLENRQALEERMDGMPGLEYRIIVEPKTPEEEARGIYVIRKQERIKRPNYPDEIKILGT
ncbi:hypothetical protein LTS18_000152, partial [Coniosporium uncinatum]